MLQFIHFHMWHPRGKDSLLGPDQVEHKRELKTGLDKLEEQRQFIFTQDDRKYVHV